MAKRGTGGWSGSGPAAGGGRTAWWRKEQANAEAGGAAALEEGDGRSGEERRSLPIVRTDKHTRMRNRNCHFSRTDPFTPSQRALLKICPSGFGSTRNKGEFMTIKVCSLLVIALICNCLKVRGGEITNTVNITSNLVMYMTLYGNGEPVSQFKCEDHVQYLIRGTTIGQFVYFRRFPSGNFEFRLFDALGNEMTKSNAGTSASESPRLPTSNDFQMAHTKYERIAVTYEGVDRGALLCPQEMFNITNKGVYDLEVRARICVILTNGVPDYSALVDGRNVTGAGDAFVDKFGTVESPPLRVKVVKD